MDTTLEFYAPVQAELERVEQNLKALCAVGFSPMANLLSHVFSAPGKRIRPAITLLASRLSPGGDSEAPILMATAVELLHIATLIHDDTVDNAAVRRNRATVSSVWGPQVAVLLGDYVFATSATYVCDTKNVRVIRRFSETIMELSTGELMERFTAYDPQLSREDYWERIYNKTASLFSTAAESGAVLSGAPEPAVQGLKAYGKYVGMAFQIVDDILDFEGVSEEVGKPVGSDLAQGTLTLPAIMLLERFPQDNPIPLLFQGSDREANLRRALDLVQSGTIIQDAYGVAADFCRQATEALAPLRDSPSKRHLLDIAAYVLERRR